ncbi:hypothetical protein CKF54_02450 [Psittacicella hinzii]|uniref:TraG P-loop domain-containing protein n=1 Tax=Psittacicella hinzii TaxID=2028575 RepID=A0A3A1Y603_9GAMM|nr:TraC family protein [Psittacicella hinzii]RIY33683.1 hypothetical protein CKF54_02450 [Psittacicella hinzii]
MHVFADHLDVQAFDQATGAFICSSGYLGYIWQTEPLAGVNSDLESQIHGMLQLELPEQSYLSFTLIADDYLLPYYNTYQRLRLGEKQFAQSTEMRLQFLQNLQEDGSSNCNLRNYILLVSLKLHHKGSITPEVLAEYQQYCAQTQQALQSIFGQVHRLNDRDYLFCLRNLLLSKTYQELAQSDSKFTAYDPLQTLANQVIPPSATITRHKNCLELDGQLVQVFTTLEIPSEFACGQAVSYLGDLYTGITPLTHKFALTCSLYFVKQMASKAVVETKRNYTLRQMTGPLARFVPRLKQTAEAFEVLVNDLNSGDKLVKLSWTLLAWLPPEVTYADYLQAQGLQEQADISNDSKPDPSKLEYQDWELLDKVKLALPQRQGQDYSKQKYPANSRIASAQAFAVKIKSYFQTLGWSLDFESHVQLPVFFNALPLNQDPGGRSFLQRERTMSTTQASVCLPLFAEWKGAPLPIVPLVSRTGQVLNLDLFASQTNFNCCIAAQSGSGKSFLVNEMVANLLATGAQCWIIDIGRSYKKLTEVYHGEFVEFSIDAEININPFSLIRNYEQDADMVFTLIQAMISPKDLLSEYQANAIKQLIKDLWDQYQAGLTIDRLAQALEEQEDKRLQDLAVQIFPFTSRGAYGVYFKESSRNMISLLQELEAQTKARLVVLELEELSGRKDLQQLVLLQLIFAVNQQMIGGQKERQKVLFIDEAWDLLASKTISYFIETGYRRFRKYNGAVVTITQSIEDLYSTPSGRAIAANSANYYLLAQKDETIKQLINQDKLILDAHAIRQITSLKTRKGHYAEIFMLTDYGTGVGRLIVAPKIQLLYSTNAVDQAALKRLQELYHCDLWQAINYLLVLKEGRGS